MCSVYHSNSVVRSHLYRLLTHHVAWLETGAHVHGTVDSRGCRFLSWSMIDCDPRPKASGGARGMACARVARTTLRINLLFPTAWVSGVLSAVGATVAGTGLQGGDALQLRRVGDGLQELSSPKLPHMMLVLVVGTRYTACIIQHGPLRFGRCRQSFFAGTACRRPSMTRRSMRPGARMSWRKRSCCSNSSARSVGPG